MMARCLTSLHRYACFKLTCLANKTRQKKALINQHTSPVYARLQLEGEEDDLPVSGNGVQVKIGAGQEINLVLTQVYAHAQKPFPEEYVFVACLTLLEMVGGGEWVSRFDLSSLSSSHTRTHTHAHTHTRTHTHTHTLSLSFHSVNDRIHQKDEQLFKFHGNLYFASPYPTTSQKTKVITSGKLESHTKVRPLAMNAKQHASVCLCVCVCVCVCVLRLCLSVRPPMHAVCLCTCCVLCAHLFLVRLAAGQAREDQRTRDQLWPVQRYGSKLVQGAPGAL